MALQQRRFSAEFKAKVALEAVRGQKTLAELADEHNVHTNQITRWNKKLLESLPEIFGRRDGIGVSHAAAIVTPDLGRCRRTRGRCCGRRGAGVSARGRPQPAVGDVPCQTR